MGIFSNTVSVCQFNVIGKLPGDLFEFAAAALNKNAFQPIDDTNDESSTGWVNLFDPRENTFHVPRDFYYDHYLGFTFRRDQRKIPAMLLKTRLKEEEQRFLAENPNYRKMPFQKKNEVKDAIKLSLLGKTLPVPTTYDAVWDTESNIVTFANISAKTIELFSDFFKKTFEGLHLDIIHPYARAEKLLDKNLSYVLKNKCQISPDNILGMVNEFRWLGTDFMQWLMYNTLNDSSRYLVNQPGPLSLKEYFTAHLDDRFILVSEIDESVQKVVVSGPQNHYSEVCAAMKKSKTITEANIAFERGEDKWSINLKGDMFYFSSFSCPQVKIERDEGNDETDEKEAAFYERMLLLEKGLQLFDSLYTTFLGERLTDAWAGFEKKSAAWLAKTL